MDNLSKKIKEALIQSMRDDQQKQFIFEGIDEGDVKTLDEFFSENNVEDYIWEQDLEEALYDQEDLHEDEKPPMTYKVGDIIMTTRFNSRGQQIENSPHRVLIITASEDREGVATYRGFVLSSKVEKSNKHSKYPHNIYINNYSTILYKGTPYNKEAFIRVDDLVEFSSDDLSERGSWKGSANHEFMNFVQRCYDNYKRGIDNSNMYWEK